MSNSIMLLTPKDGATEFTTGSHSDLASTGSQKQLQGIRDIQLNLASEVQKRAAEYAKSNWLNGWIRKIRLQASIRRYKQATAMAQPIYDKISGDVSKDLLLQKGDGLNV